MSPFDLLGLETHHAIHEHILMDQVRSYTLCYLDIENLQSA